MHRCWLPVRSIGTSALLLALAGSANAAGSAGDSTDYVRPGGELQWLTIEAPLAMEQLGAIAAAEVDRVRAAEGGAPVPPPLPVEGSTPPEAPGEGWTNRSLSGSTRGKAPLGARSLDGACACATVIGDQRAKRVAALFAQATFLAGDEVDTARVLDLQLRYSDGVIVWLNGREITRRGISRESGSMMAADRPNGPEWESFYVPVERGWLRRGENLLSIEVRPHRQERAPVLDVGLTARGGARLVRGPIVQWRGETAATISFETDLPAHSLVRVRTEVDEKPRDIESAGGALASHHRVEIPDLKPGSTVRYRIIVGGDVTDEFAFRTAPRAEDVIRFGIYGDMRGGHRVHARIIDSLLDEAPDFVVVTGDLVLRGSDEGGWQRFFEIVSPLMARTPYFPAIGNHDLGEAGDEGRRMNDIFGLPTAAGRPDWAHWYSFDVGAAHFVVLDSNAFDSKAQLEWLRKDLGAAQSRGVRAIFAAVHDGPYSRGTHGGSALARDVYAPVLAEAGVLLLFSGHDHIYQRGEINGLRYIVSGGGGAPLYPIRCGGGGRSRCEIADGAQIATSEHHYVIVTLYRDYVQVCPRRPDRTPLEKCVRYRPPHRG